MPDRFTLSVPDMSCGHCRASIKGALEPLGVEVSFDPEARRVTLAGPLTLPAAISALDAIGFPATPV